MKITVGQALLMLMQYSPDDITLQKLYLNGAASDEDHAKINAYLQSPLFYGIEISRTHDDINDDPTRRYFETHLAQHTLSQQLSNMPLAKIETLYRDFQSLLPKSYISQFRIPLDEVLSGKVHTSKFEYQTKILNLLNELNACESVVEPAKRIAILQKISEKLLKEMQNPMTINYIEAQYQTCLKALQTMIEATLNAGQQSGIIYDADLAKLLRSCKMRGLMFNKAFDKFGKDPGYENTGREFSQIIMAIANERATIMKLARKIQAMTSSDEDYLLKIEKLLTSYFPLLENDTIKNHLQPTLQKIQELKETPAVQGDAIAAIVHELDKVADNFKKMYILARCGYVSTVVAINDPKSLPYNVYNSGYFLGEKRGRLIKGSSQTSTRSQNFGLLKSSMPTASDDVAHTHKGFSFMKPVEQSDFVAGSDWVEDNFNRLVHPFSNSISGTMLIQARTMLALMAKSQKYSSDDCNEYFKLFIANMLFRTGGHSLHEYIQPLNITEINHALGYPSTVTNEDFFYDDNGKAFNQALLETIEYNRQFLLRKQLLDEIKLMPVKLKATASQIKDDDTFGSQVTVAPTGSAKRIRPATSIKSSRGVKVVQDDASHTTSLTIPIDPTKRRTKKPKW